MDSPLIAIVGSAEANRTYDPALSNAAEAKHAAEEIGAALAAAGYRIIVYDAYIESNVVRGFVKAGSAARKSIIVQYATGQAGVGAFPEYEQNKDIFEQRQDETDNWEISFYRSLGRVDGIVLIGGGRSTLIAGVIALTYRIPLVALAKYGGSSLTVWKSLKSGRYLASDAEVITMTEEGTSQTAKSWIESLGTQMKARAKKDRKQNPVWPSVLTLLLLIAWVVLIPVGDWLLPQDKPAAIPFVFKLLLFIAPMIAGASGATIRAIVPEGGEMTFRDTVKGVAAGIISALLYVSAQLVSNQTPNTTVLIFAVAFGFIAGFTFDRVFKKLETVDALRLGSLDKSAREPDTQ